MRSPLKRHDLVVRMRGNLERYSFPRLQMLLLVGLYRRLRGMESQHWLETAIKRTAWPFAITGVLLVACGWGMQTYAPEAHTIGQVVVHAKADARD